MSKETLFSILKSVCIAGLVAFVLSVAATSKWFDWHWFVGIFVGQFVLFGFVGMVLDRMVVAKQLNEVVKDQTKVVQEAITKQSLSLNCAYCNTQNTDIPIILAEENTFKCRTCGQENVVYMQFYAARRTKPIETPTLEGPGASL